MNSWVGEWGPRSEWLEYGNDPEQRTAEGRMLGGPYVRPVVRNANGSQRCAPQTKPKRHGRRRYEGTP